METGYNKNWAQDIRANSTDISNQTTKSGWDAYEEKIIKEINDNYRNLPPDQFNRLINKVTHKLKEAKEGRLKLQADTSALLTDLKKEVVSNSSYTDELKNILYTPLRLANGFDGISEDTSKNTTVANFAKGVIDEFCSLPEIIELLASDEVTRKKFMEGLKNLSFSSFISTMWDSVKDLGSGDAYKTGRAAVFTGMTALGIGGLLKGLGTAGVKLSAKMSSVGAAKTTAKEAGKGALGQTTAMASEVGKITMDTARQTFEAAKTSVASIANTTGEVGKQALQAAQSALQAAQSALDAAKLAGTEAGKQALLQASMQASQAAQQLAQAVKTGAGVTQATANVQEATNKVNNLLEANKVSGFQKMANIGEKTVQYSIKGLDVLFTI
ncbi:MAG: hypothetical protein PHE25_04690, partial [Candidatus Gracilibacteria bacterium]|nr:hypothetical protein [Candidatus Gracilibacteria bacterium]